LFDDTLNYPVKLEGKVGRVVDLDSHNAKARAKERVETVMVTVCATSFSLMSS
jgi:hypothetical protein